MAFKQNSKTHTGIRKLLASRLAVLSILLIVTGISCQAPAPTPTAPTLTSTSPELNISGFAFVPATFTVAGGTTVTWTNQDDARHDVTSETGIFDSGNLARSATYSYTFAERGTFGYYCTIHPSMRGKVIVE